MSTEHAHYGDPTSVGVTAPAQIKAGNGYMPTGGLAERFVVVAGGPEKFANSLMLQRETEEVIKEHWSITAQRSRAIHIVSVQLRLASSFGIVNALKASREELDERRNVLNGHKARKSPAEMGEWRERAEKALKLAEDASLLCQERNDALIREDL